MRRILYCDFSDPSPRGIDILVVQQPQHGNVILQDNRWRGKCMKCRLADRVFRILKTRFCPTVWVFGQVDLGSVIGRNETPKARKRPTWVSRSVYVPGLSLAFRCFNFSDIFLHCGGLLPDFFAHFNLLSHLPNFMVQVGQLGIKFGLLLG